MYYNNLQTTNMQNVFGFNDFNMKRTRKIYLDNCDDGFTSSASTSPTSSDSGNSHDEISRSLKMYAMLAAYSNATDSPYSQQSRVDVAMQDFACNGYVSDDLNSSKTGMHLPNNAGNAQANMINILNLSNSQQYFNNGITPQIKSAPTNSALNQQQLHALQQRNFKQNFNINLNNNLWKMLPIHMEQQTNAVSAAAAVAGAATATAAANIHYNCNPKKLTKRFNSSKNEKYSAIKHCVFCDNNNEPEAVVKCHSVRDSLGRVLCPKLRTYVCPICKASGDNAHTVKYCPEKPIITMEDAIKADSYRFVKGAYKQQMKV